MKKFINILIVGAITAAYLLAVRFIAPADQPYFILAIALVGLVSWFFGAVTGIIYALLLIPVTNFVYHQITTATYYMSLALSPAYIGTQVISALAMGHLRKEKQAQIQLDEDLKDANTRLQQVLHNVQELGGIHHLCSTCKKIQDDDEEWMEIDRFLMDHTKIEFSHSICPDCAKEYGNATKEPIAFKPLSGA